MLKSDRRSGGLSTSSIAGISVTIVAVCALISNVMFRYYKYARSKNEAILVEKKMAKWDDIYSPNNTHVTSNTMNYDLIYNVDVENAESDASQSLVSSNILYTSSRQSKLEVKSTSPIKSLEQSPGKKLVSNVVLQESETLYRQGTIENVDKEVASVQRDNKT